MKGDKLLISDVTSITRQLCDFFEGGQHDVICTEVDLLDENKLKNYLAFLVCPVDEITEALENVSSMNGKDIHSFELDPKYCLITLFENNMHSRSSISFNEQDDFPIKANFSSEYQYIDLFFQRFLNYSHLFGDNLYRYFDEMIESTLKFGVEAAYTKKK